MPMVRVRARVRRIKDELADGAGADRRAEREHHAPATARARGCNPWGLEWCSLRAAQATTRPARAATLLLAAPLL